MAKSSKDKYEKDILKVIKDNNLFVITDIFAFYTGIKRSQFYNLKLDKSDSLLKAIDDNKSKTKVSLKNMWLKSGNPTLQIALYKLIGTREEYMALANARQEMDIPGIEKIGEIVLTSVKSNGKNTRNKGN